MSMWTHVNGSIRVDHVPILSAIDFEKILGPIVNWDDEEQRDTHLPCGSEGSLQYNIWTNPDKSHMAAYTVNIFGDLRDFDSVDEVVRWFEKTLKKFRMIRSAILEVEVEDGSLSVARWDQERKGIHTLYKKQGRDFNAEPQL